MTALTPTERAALSKLMATEVMGWRLMYLPNMWCHPNGGIVIPMAKYDPTTNDAQAAELRRAVAAMREVIKLELWYLGDGFVGVWINDGDSQIRYAPTEAEATCLTIAAFLGDESWRDDA